MATVNSLEIVNEIIEGNGYYAQDTRVIRIVRYNNQFNGGLAYGLIYEGEDRLRYHRSLACINPTTIWDCDEKM
jgi:hypothetical protein